MLGLWMNAKRIDTRRTYNMIQAIRDSFSPSIPIDYFRAIYDTEEEASAMHALHESRCASASQGPIGEV